MLSLDPTAETLAEATGVEPAHAMRGDLANRCHTVRRRLHRLAEGTGVEPASDKCAVVFGTTALPVRLPFRTFPIFNCRLPIDSESGRPIGNRQLAIGNELVHVVGLAPTKDNQVRLISKEGAFAAQPHMRDRFEISDLTVKISDSRSLRAKK